MDRYVGEECDPPNPGPGCIATCKKEGCGNGKVDPGEDCDGGPDPSGAYNTAKETSACNSNCTWARRGEGKVNHATGEDCDGNNGLNCESPTCNSDCTIRLRFDSAPGGGTRAFSYPHGLREAPPDSINREGLLPLFLRSLD